MTTLCLTFAYVFQFHFDLIIQKIRSFVKFSLQKMSGGDIFGFNNAVFLSEREAADRNYALGFYMRENKCFPEKCNLRECMDFYFQVRNEQMTIDININ